jgi:divinyl protochlorophyllide a 8-vinyl-reductase
VADGPPLSHASHIGRIGPNAIIRVAEALEHLEGSPTRTEIFRHAELDHYLAQAPDAMVPEHEVTRLQRTLRERLSAARAVAVNREAGRLTGQYLLAHRIPGIAQAILRRLPPGYANRLLLKAIGGHTWTFAGSGDVELLPGPPARIRIRRCPLCRELKDDGPVCDYYAATFEHLYRTLVAGTAVARELTCQAHGADACVFELNW